MKEFMKSNTVTYNLMSFTGYKSLIIFSMLMEGPKSYEELQKKLQEHPYLHEKISIDTLRIYINSLKEMGCKIEKITKNHIAYYSISERPFKLKINDEQAKSVLKVYKAISKSVSISEFMSLQKFFEKFSVYIENNDLKERFKKLSPLSHIKPEIVSDLIKYSKNNTEITVLYNSENSGKKDITILPDKLEINNGKLYLYGINSEYENYSGFLVSKIVKIESINIHKSSLNVPMLVVRYELTEEERDVELLSCEKIISKSKNKLTIEISSRNKFDITQRILSHGSKCKVISPNNFREEIISALKQMKEGYFEEE